VNGRVGAWMGSWTRGRGRGRGCPSWRHALPPVASLRGLGHRRASCCGRPACARRVAVVLRTRPSVALPRAQLAVGVGPVHKTLSTKKIKKRLTESCCRRLRAPLASASPCPPVRLSCRRRAECPSGVWGLQRKASA